MQSLNSIQLFTMQNGQLVSKSSYRKFWHKIIESLNNAIGGTETIKPVIDLTCHILRHSYATNLYHAGVDVKTAQKLLGHSSISVTMDIYTHLTIDNKDIQEKLNRYIGAL